MTILGPIIHALAGLLAVLYHITHDYTISLVLITLLVEAVLHPLTRVQLRSMKAMKTLQPHIEVLRRELKDDPETLNQEIRALYRSHNANPMIGCLPMLIQYPVLLGLYGMLAQRDLFGNATVLGLSWLRLTGQPMQYVLRALPVHPVYLLALIFPALFGLATWFKQKVRMTDPGQSRRFAFISVISGCIALYVGVGLSICWTVSSVAYVGEYFLVVGRSHPKIAVPARS